MAAKRKSNHPQMIHCEYCGEDYADSYKHCPFCDERPPRPRRSQQEDDYEFHPDPEMFEDDDDDAIPRGGKRLVNNTRGGGYGGSTSPLKIVGTIVSLALIVAAVIIVISIIKPMIDNGRTTLPTTSPVTAASPTPDITTTPGSEETVPPTGTPDATPDPAPTPVVTPPPGQTATGFTLSTSDFSMSNKYPDPITIQVTFLPAGSTGTVTWTSSDPDVAAVDANGKVTHGTKSGQATITATMGGLTQTCIVRSSVTGGTTGGTISPAPNTTAPSGTLSLNKTDFTFNAADNPTVQMKVNGTSSTPTWSIGNTSVASVSASGVVKPVGPGSTTLTCTVDGQTLTCIVRCSW